jgi:hypothetical protein
MDFEGKARIVVPTMFFDTAKDTKSIFEAVGRLIWQGSRFTADEIVIGADPSCGGKSLVAYYYKNEKLIFALGAVERDGEYSYHS